MTDYANLKTYKKSQVNGLTKYLSSLRFASMNNSQAMWDIIFKRGKEFGLEVGYSEAYGERLDFSKSRKITGEQTALGKQWLKEYFFKKDGSPRSGKRTEYVSETVLGIAKSVVRFEFVGVQVLASSRWYPCSVVPIYRAFNRKGEYFDYAPIHWGQPIIMEA